MSFQKGQRSKLIARRHLAFQMDGTRSIVETSETSTVVTTDDRSYTVGESHNANIVITLVDGVAYKATPLQTDNKQGYCWSVTSGTSGETGLYRFTGTLEGFSSLEVGKYLYLTSNGYTQTPPKHAELSSDISQIVGLAIDTDTIQIIFKEPELIVR